MYDFFGASLSSVSIYTEMFSTINNFIDIQASQNKAILSVPRGVRFMIGLNKSTSCNHNLSTMTLAHRTTRHARAAPLKVGMDGVPYKDKMKPEENIVNHFFRRI